jgi:hypothetical protein
MILKFHYLHLVPKASDLIVLKKKKFSLDPETSRYEFQYSRDLHDKISCRKNKLVAR